jgi:hypothetical protein
MNNTNTITKDWWKEAAMNIPDIKTEPPGPKSRTMHANTAKYMKGFSSQAKLFPVCFEEGSGITLTDVDGNRYLDFSSGIYVTSLGHCHPKVSEAIAYWSKKLMNAHDFTTPVKQKLMEKMAGVLPGKAECYSAVLGWDHGRGGGRAGGPGHHGQPRVYLCLSRFSREDHGRGKLCADGSRR